MSALCLHRESITSRPGATSVSFSFNGAVIGTLPTNTGVSWVELSPRVLDAAGSYTTFTRSRLFEWVTSMCGTLTRVLRLCSSASHDKVDVVCRYVPSPDLTKLLCCRRSDFFRTFFYPRQQQGLHNMLKELPGVQ